jgi:beta-lactamase regulating signal transducer with metallopeptidase domain
VSGVIEAGLAAKTGLATLALMAAQGTLLALAALVLVRGGRLRPAWQAAVWLVVLAKFVLPWGPALPWSLADLVEMLRGGGEAAAAPLVLKTAPAAAAAAAPSIAPAIGWIALAAVWLAGSIVVGVRALVAHRGALAAARAAAAAPAEAQALLARLAAGVRVRAPRLVVGDAAVGPHVVGALRPVIVVPPALLEEPALLRPALLHELAHIRRRDALGRFVQVMARAAFWFFPVVRLASKRLELAREAACDAWALEAGEISRPAYARLLVQMARLRTAAAPALAAPRTLDARVSAVLGPPARPRLGWLHRIALAAWIALALGGARTASARSEASVCIYTPEVAEALRQAHPDADLDGDGFLSREEACDYQAALRKRVSEGELVPMLDETSTELLVEPLCCNCDSNEGLSPAASTGVAGASCHRAEEGVDR